MRLLIDADILVYRAGFACNDEPVQNALQACKMILGSIIRKCKHDSFTLYLTSTDGSNFRNKVAKTRKYKGNRTQDKPVHYDAIRKYLIDVHKAVVVYGQEADDALGIEQSKADDTIIVTIDKDLDQIAGEHFNFVKDDKYCIHPQQADYIFLLQLLTGDSVDNIPGLPGVGPVKAKKILKKHKKYEDRLKAVIKAYDYNIELLTEQAQLVRIRREENELWQVPEKVMQDLSTDIEAALKLEYLSKYSPKKE